MNKNYERCTRCNRRKLLTTGCLQKWLKPMECKHSKRSIDSKRDYTDSEVVSCVLLSERNQTSPTSKFAKFWKNKLFLNSSVWSLQRYFHSKVSGSDYPINKIHNPSLLGDKKIFAVSEQSVIDSKKVNPLRCSHCDGHLMLRGHRKHSSDETCAVVCQLSKHGWYWGGITSSEAEELLAGQHDNVFLVRDSYNSRHLLCVSFRCVGRTLHVRLRHANGLFSLNNETFVPANRILEHCATVDVVPNIIERPVRLARPLNRFAKLDSLQMICRFVIRKTVPSKEWSNLPLPPNMISYISLGSDYISHNS